jgi:5-methylcytosine-specific restriction endonuclease McrA
MYAHSLFYKARAWINKRERVLRRDEYLCQECKRYGKGVQATTVHHINPLNQHPEWGLMSWNLVSLCEKCHDAMHDRKIGELTEKGKAWIKRVSPPPQK